MSVCVCVCVCVRVCENKGYCSKKCSWSLDGYTVE